MNILSQKSQSINTVLLRKCLYFFYEDESINFIVNTKNNAVKTMPIRDYSMLRKYKNTSN